MSDRALWGAYVACAVLASVVALLPLFVPFDDACTLHIVRPGGQLMEEPSRLFFLGTDSIGRSEALRLFFAIRTSLALSTAATAIALGLGLVVGLASSTPSARALRPWIPVSADALLLFIVEVSLAVPFVLLVVSLAAVLDEVTPVAIVLVMAASAAPTAAKLVRDRAVRVQRERFVDAAYALGAKEISVLLRHVAEPCIRLLLTLAPAFFAQLLLAEAALGYLGLGLPPPAATLGNLLADGQDFLADAPRLLLLPCAAVVILVAASGSVSSALATRQREVSHGDR